MPIRAVVFDLFDTLVDLSMEGLPLVTVGGRSFPSTVGVLHELVSEHVDIPIAELGEVVRDVDQALRAPRAELGKELPTLERMQELVKRLGIRDSQLPARLTGLHMRLLRGQVTALDHHPAVISELKAQGLRVGVCSNFSHSQTAFRVLEDAGLRWLLDAVIISDAVSWRKPRPEIFHATLAALGVDARETLHVGDSLEADIGGAQVLGMRTAWITRCIADPEAVLSKYEGPGPDHVVGDLAEVPGLV